MFIFNVFVTYTYLEIIYLMIHQTFAAYEPTILLKAHLTTGVTGHALIASSTLVSCVCCV